MTCNISILLTSILPLILLSIPSTQSYSFIGNEIKDLESTDANFITEAGPWSASSLMTPGLKHSQCEGAYLLGGYNILPMNADFSRTYTGLPSHNMIYVNITFWLLDSWNTGDRFRLEFDSNYFEAFSGMHHSSLFPNVQRCGNNTWRDLGRLEFMAKVFHSGSTLTIKLINKMDDQPYDESFGIRNVSLRFVTALPTDANSYCGKTIVTLPNHDCACPNGKYMRNPSDCQNCDSSCKTCYGATSSNCLSCNDGYYLSSGQCLPCHSFCAKCYGPSQHQCISCNPTYYLLSGQSCLDSCDPPMIAGTVGSTLVCDYNCASNKYVYPDGACLDSCSQYFNPVLSNGRKFCQYYCTVTQFYYSPDGTCSTSCPSGFYEDSTYRYCQPCQDSLCAECSAPGTPCTQCIDGAILDTDGVCKRCQVMEVRYVKSTTNGDQFKVRLLPTSTCKLDPTYVKNYLLPTAEARNAFPPFSFNIKQLDPTSYLLDISFDSNVLEESGMNLVLGNLTGVAIITKKFVPTKTQQDIAKTAPTVNKVIGGALGAGLVGAVALGTTAALWSMISFQQFIGYFIYINVEYPFHTEFFLSLLQSTSLDFLPNPLASITEFFANEYSTIKIDVTSTTYQPPRKFVKYDGTSFFLENGGSAIAIGLTLLLLNILLPHLLKIRIMAWRILLAKFHSHLRWNIIARTFLESGIPLILAVFLQLRKISFRSFYTISSTGLAFVGLFYYMVMLYWLFKVLRPRGNYLLEGGNTRMQIGTLYQGMSLKFNYAKYYHIIILIRGSLLMFFIAFLEVSPIVQIAPLIFFNAGLVYYLFKMAGFQNSKLNFINRLKEILILIGEIGVMGLTFKGGSEDYYQIVGWVIVGVFGAAITIELTYMFGIQIIQIIRLRKHIWNSVRMLGSKLKDKKVPKHQLSTLDNLQHKESYNSRDMVNFSESKDEKMSVDEF